MLATVDPQTALRLLGVEHAAVREVIAVLTDEEMLYPDTIRYGLYPEQKLSFKDLLAHLITYEAYSLECVAEWRQGRKHPILDTLATAEGSRSVHFGGIAARADKSLAAVLDEWEQTQASLEQMFAKFNEEEWRSPAPYPTDEPTDLGGMLEEILVSPPRPMYRHLPVHVPDSQAYIASLRAIKAR